MPSRKADQLKMGSRGTVHGYRPCYIIHLTGVDLDVIPTHHARFGIEGYHAIIKIARDHLLPYIYIYVTGFWKTVPNHT